MWYSIISIFNCHSSFDKQCFSVVSWLIVAVSQYFVALHAQHFPSRFAYAQLEEKCWAFRQQNIVTRLQWALIQLRNIAYRMKNDKEKIRIIEYHILFCAIVHDFSCNLCDWLKTDILLMLRGSPADCLSLWIKKLEKLLSFSARSYHLNSFRSSVERWTRTSSNQD